MRFPFPSTLIKLARAKRTINTVQSEEQEPFSANFFERLVKLRFLLSNQRKTRVVESTPNVVTLSWRGWLLSNLEVIISRDLRKGDERGIEETFPNPSLPLCFPTPI